MITAYRATLILFASCVATPGAAQVYKCKDAKGHVTYSTSVCSDKAVVIVPAVPNTVDSSGMREQANRLESRRSGEVAPGREGVSSGYVPIPGGNAIESQIDGSFEGWDGETVVKLMNGQIWIQSEYHYDYHYAYMPKVVVYRTRGGYKMKVDGVRRDVRVELLR